MNRPFWIAIGIAVIIGFIPYAWNLPHWVAQCGVVAGILLTLGAFLWRWRPGNPKPASNPVDQAGRYVVRVVSNGLRIPASTQPEASTHIHVVRGNPTAPPSGDAQPPP